MVSSSTVDKYIYDYMLNDEKKLKKFKKFVSVCGEENLVKVDKYLRKYNWILNHEFKAMFGYGNLQEHNTFTFFFYLKGESSAVFFILLKYFENIKFNSINRKVKIEIIKWYYLLKWKSYIPSNFNFNLMNYPNPPVPKKNDIKRVKEANIKLSNKALLKWSVENHKYFQDKNFKRMIMMLLWANKNSRILISQDIFKFVIMEYLSYHEREYYLYIPFEKRKKKKKKK